MHQKAFVILFFVLGCSLRSNETSTFRLQLECMRDARDKCDHLTEDDCNSSSYNIINGQCTKGERHCVCAVVPNTKGDYSPDNLTPEVSCSITSAR